ncbi:IclR family transcriptional regulator C-terminal domain-containing protein [Streptomyces xanthochromogenes]|uniref:IclR family transcriptional regulator domain-containing protein n=1 Tax=Streptomyces xanthochromogenes TaxID=67384 RepID=UPI00343596B3
MRAGDWEPAENWLRRAYVQQHPGAAFRLAVVFYRRGDLAEQPAVTNGKLLAALADAARWGHRDAQLLLTTPRTHPLPAGNRPMSDGEVEDPEFVPDVAAALALARQPAPCPANSTATATAVPPLPPVPPTPHVPPGTASTPTSPVFVAGMSQLWSPEPLRAAPLRSLAQQVPQEPHSPDQWQSALRVLDVLDTISGADRPLSAERLSQTTSLPQPVMTQLLVWLCEQGLAEALGDGGYIPGPVLHLMSQPDGSYAEHALQHALSGLRDTVSAAVYVSSYTAGEVTISQYADGPTAPKVHEWVDFRAAAHASAVGKSLLAQLDFDSRMDHLSRRQPVRLTSRTITDHQALFRTLDGHGPQAAQFDLLEYSPREVCVAVPLAIGGQTACVALSLPSTQKHRLLDAARALSNRSAGLLLSLLLTRTPAGATTSRHPDTCPPDTFRPITPPSPPAPPGDADVLRPGPFDRLRPTPPDVSLSLLGLHLPPTINTPAPRIRHLISSNR